MSKANAPDEFNETLRRNKPSLIMPIINSVFAFGLMIFVVIYTINGSFKIWYCLLFVFILILFPMASWYNSYFSKKANTKKIYNYQKETELLVKYASRYRNYTAIDIKNDNKILFEPETAPSSDFTSVCFNVDSCLFKEHDPKDILITLGISFAGFAVDSETLYIKDIVGLLPCSIWYYKKLKTPNAKEAKVKINVGTNTINKKQVFKMLNRSDVYYDKKTGWLLIGERKQTILDEAYKIANDAIIVLREQELISLYIKIAPNIIN